MYGGYGAGFHSFSELETNGIQGENIIIFGVSMSSSVHIDDKNNYIFILGKGPIQGLYDTTLSAETQYSININRNSIGRVFDFSVDYKTFDISDITNIHKNLIKNQ